MIRIFTLFGSHLALNISSQGHTRRRKTNERKWTAAVYTCSCMLYTNLKEKAKSRNCNGSIFEQQRATRLSEISRLARKRED